jgi:hypothetical protein
MIVVSGNPLVDGVCLTFTLPGGVFVAMLLVGDFVVEPHIGTANALPDNFIYGGHRLSVTGRCRDDKSQNRDNYAMPTAPLICPSPYQFFYATSVETTDF